MSSTSTSGYSCADLGDDAPPETRGLEHVRLVDGRQPAAPLARELEAATGDALDLRGVVLARVEDRSVLAHAARAEVEAADELANEEQIDVAPDRRAKVRVDVELGPQLQHPLLRANVGSVELGIAYRRLEHCRRATAGRERLVGKRRSRRPDRRRAEDVLLELEIGRDLTENTLRDGHHLGPDAVAGQADDARAVLRAGHEESRHYKLGSEP